MFTSQELMHDFHADGCIRETLYDAVLPVGLSVLQDLSEATLWRS